MDDPAHADKFKFTERLGLVEAHIAEEEDGYYKRTSKKVYYPKIRVLEGGNRADWDIWCPRRNASPGHQTLVIPKLITDIPKSAENDEDTEAKATDKVS